MAQVKINVKNMVGEAIADAQVALNLGNNGIVAKITDAEGNTSVSGIAVGDLPISITKEPYQKQDITLKIETADAVVQKDVILLNIQTNTKVEDDVKTEIVDPIANQLISAFTFGTPTNIDEAKIAYKKLEDNINNQKFAIETMLKDGLTDIAQQQGSNLIYTMKTQLQASMDYYVSARSKLNPYRSLKEFGQWTEMTSCIAAIYWLRNNLVRYTNKLLEKVTTLAQEEIKKL